MSVAETVFWGVARNHKLGFEFRRQHPIGGYILDFFCREAMLAVEFDGEQHDPVQDSRRDSKLQVLGIETLRVPNREFLLIDVSEEPNKDWVEAIVRRCEERAGRQVPR